MIFRISLVLSFLIVVNVVHAEMTPEEQMLSVAIQGEEASLAAASSGTTAVRSAIEILIHKKDDQIKELQTQINDLKAQLVKSVPNVQVQSK